MFFSQILPFGNTEPTDILESFVTDLKEYISCVFVFLAERYEN